MSRPAAAASQRPIDMSFGTLIIGDEILSGHRQDRHLARVIHALESRGLALSWARYVGDEPARIEAELRAAAASGDTVFSFGGIGATPDDHTRQCAARALGRELALHPGAAALIEQRGREVAADKGAPYDTTGPEHRRRLQMGVFPAGAELIPNPYNRIPGFSVGELHFMPGFPVMAHPMLDWLLDTRYAHLRAAHARALRAVRVRGTNESALIPIFERVELAYGGVRTFSLPSVDHPEFGPHIEIGVKGADADEVDAAMAALRQGAAAAGAVEILSST